MPNFLRTHPSHLVKLLALLQLAVPLLPGQAQAAPLTLQEATHKALERSADLAVAKARLEELRATRSKITTAYLPQVQAVGTYTHNSTEAKFDSGAMIVNIGKVLGVTVPADKLPPPSYIQRANSLGAVVSVDQTVFALTPVLLARAADKSLEAQTASLAAARREIVYQVRQLFYNYQGVQRLTEVAERAVALGELRIASAQQRRTLGAEADLAVLRAETERDRGLADLLRAKGAAKQILVVLGTLLGTPAPEQLAAAEPLVVDSAAAVDRDQALRSRPDFAARRLAVQSADASVREAELRWMPMITLGANARYTDTAGFAGENWLWAATANLVVPIFDRGVRYADARERRATRSRLNLELDKAERDLDAGLAVAREDLDNAKASLALAQQQAQRAKRTAAVVAAALAAGGATSLEVAEADTNLRQSEANAAREQITLDLAILRLQHLAGAIHAPDEN